MKNQRRFELGKMFLDISKYLATVGLIGSIVGGRITLGNVLVMGTVIFLTCVIGVTVIPGVEKEK